MASVRLGAGAVPTLEACGASSDSPAATQRTGRNSCRAGHRGEAFVLLLHRGPTRARSRRVRSQRVLDEVGRAQLWVATKWLQKWSPCGTLSAASQTSAMQRTCEGVDPWRNDRSEFFTRLG